MGQGQGTDARRRPFVGRLVYNARPISLNASYGHARFERTQHVREWRDAFYWLAREQQVPALQAIEVTVEVGMSGQMQDIGNAYVSAKAAIDGLVAAGVIPDDDGDHLVVLSFLPPERVPPTEPDYMALNVVEVTASLQKRIAGALRSAIHAHGPIDLNQIGSATKRIIGYLK